MSKSLIDYRMFDIAKIREDFPILGREVNGRKLVYFDSGATAQKPRQVIELTAELMAQHNANIHRGVHHLSGAMTDRYEAARERVRAFIGAEHKEEIIFTSGATMSLNLVATAWSAQNLKAGDNIIVSEMEHHSNIVPWQLAAMRHGAELRVLPFDDRGILPERVRSGVGIGERHNLGRARGADASAGLLRCAGAIPADDLLHGDNRRHNGQDLHLCRRGERDAVEIESDL